MLEPLLGEVDFINLMTVNPGLGGHSFITASLDRIRQLKEMILRSETAQGIRIQVDGGITSENVADVTAAGASILVVGNYFLQSSRPRCSYG